MEKHIYTKNVAKTEKMEQKRKTHCVLQVAAIHEQYCFSLMFTDFPYVFYRVAFIFIDFHYFH